VFGGEPYIPAYSHLVRIGQIIQLPLAGLATKLAGGDGAR